MQIRKPSIHLVHPPGRILMLLALLLAVASSVFVVADFLSTQAALEAQAAPVLAVDNAAVSYQADLTASAYMAAHLDRVSSARTADLDGDSRLDILTTAVISGRLVWYQNQGSLPLFAFKTIPVTSTVFYAIDPVDFDGDGDVDFTAAVNNGVHWYENDGSDLPQFSTRIVTDVANARSLRAADVDGDSDMDVVFAYGPNDTVAWYENEDMTFSQHIITTTADLANSVDVADLDGDGDVDVLSASRNDDTVAWYENDGNTPPAFATHAITTTADGAYVVRAADVDKDGDVDVLSASMNDDTVAWYENDGNAPPTFTAHIVTTSADQVRDVRVADLDGDGDKDLLVAADTTSTPTDDVLAWYENDGTPVPNFTFHVVSAVTNGARTAEPGDLDGDSDMDFVSVYPSDGRVSWYENDGLASPHFTRHSPFYRSQGAHSVYTADLDGDGDIDALSGGFFHGVTWYENNGAALPLFTTHPISTPYRTSHSVSTADLDGDNDMDILAAAHDDHAIVWYENDGSVPPTFTPRLIADDALEAKFVFAADVNGDGYVDVLSASVFDGKIAWYESDGAPLPAFSPHVITLDAAGARQVQAADLDGDNDLDVLATAFIYDSVFWFENDGALTPTWSTHTMTDTLGGAHGLDTADLDGDDDLDVLATAADDGVIIWFENDGNASPDFTSHTLAAGLNRPLHVHAVDLNGDSNLDVLTAVRVGNTVAWYENNGSLPLDFTGHTISTQSLNPVAVHAADLDGDGDPDPLSASSTPGEVIWYENRRWQVGLVTTDTAPATMTVGTVDDLLQITLGHNGRADDPDVALSSLELRLETGIGDPLTGTVANNLIERLTLYRDDGSGAFEVATDTPITTVASLAPVDGRLSLQFGNDNPLVHVVAGTSADFFIVVELALPAPLQVPNQFRLVHLTDSEQGPASTITRWQEDTLLPLRPAADVPSSAVTAVDQPIVQLEMHHDGPTWLGETTHFTATTTGGTNVTHLWGFGDGNVYDGGALTVTHTYQAAGSYKAVLTATNSANTITATGTVTVSERRWLYLPLIIAGE